jgi:signal transduction histidine kinase
LTTTVEDLNAVINRSLRLVHHEFNVHHITVVREFTTPLPGRSIDRIRIEQVFVNLFMNASQSMAGGGTLTVRTLTRGDDVIVEVLDTGAGIPTEALAKVFDPFFTTKPVGIGTGMGLAVAKQILLQHSGDISLTNRPTGGVCATVIFHNGKEHDHAANRDPGNSDRTN